MPRMHPSIKELGRRLDRITAVYENFGVSSYDLVETCVLEEDGVYYLASEFKKDGVVLLDREDVRVALAIVMEDSSVEMASGEQEELHRFHSQITWLFANPRTEECAPGLCGEHCEAQARVRAALKCDFGLSDEGIDLAVTLRRVEMLPRRMREAVQAVA